MPKYTKSELNLKRVRSLKNILTRNKIKYTDADRKEDLVKRLLSRLGDTRKSSTKRRKTSTRKSSTKTRTRKRVGRPRTRPRKRSY